MVDRYSSTASPEAICRRRTQSVKFASIKIRSRLKTIDLLTRPGTDKLRGGASFNFNDESLNSRNPFAISSSKRTPFQFRQYNFNLNGPLVKRKASYFVEFNRNETDDNELIRATVLDSNFNTQ